MRRAVRQRLRMSVLVVLAVIGSSQLLRLDAVGAGFSGSTHNGPNAATALAVQLPTSIGGSATLNTLPLLTCRINLTWTASTTPDVTGYQIRRVRASSGDVVAGPWAVGPTTTAYTDNPVPFELLSSSYAWEVRTLRSSWSSQWARGMPSNYLSLCLL